MILFLNEMLGLHDSAGSLTWTQMAARTFIAFIFGLVLVRFADRRFLGRHAGFDVVLAIILGSVLSRGINGNAPFPETLVACVLLVLLHRLVAMITCRWAYFSKLVKGGAVVLARDGVVDHVAMKRCGISPNDLEESFRLSAGTTHTAAIKEARLERNGEISVVTRSELPPEGKPRP